MPSPRKSHAPANEIHPGLEPIEAFLFDQVETELAEAETGSIVAEPPADYRVHAGVGVARSIAVAMLGAQVRHSQQDQAPQIDLKLIGRRGEFREDLHRGPPARIDHERQIT